jgi:glycosyltransferase involved in cell wall biosynthesis
MKIGIDFSPLSSGHFLQHRVRGTGFYLANLKESLEKNFPENEYTFFKRGKKLPNDIELIHYPYFEPFFLTLPFKNKVKTVVTVHDLTPLVFKEYFPPGRKGQLKWQIQKRALKNADMIITDSNSSKNDIHKYTGIPVSKIEVVYLASSPHFKKSSKNKEQRTKISKKYQLPDNFLLYVGDATWNKNLSNLIKAVNMTNYSLVIAGSAFKNKDFDRSNPWNKDLHEARVLAEANDKIKVLGFVPDEDLVALYNLATAFIMPSYYEGFGLPVLEAMSSGCPVITTKKGSIPEVADSAAYFVEPDSVESIKEGIDEVMENEDLRKALSEKGLTQARRFDWKKTAFNTLKVYEKVLGS